MEKQGASRVLEIFLSLWEDLMFMLQLTQESSVGPVKHWAELRDYLLRYRQGMPFDNERFTCPQGIENMPQPGIPETLASWVGCSKRVFRVNKEMQSMFTRIKMGNIKVCDLTRPFPAFGIELAEPIMSRTGKKSSFIMVSNYPALIFPDPRLKDFIVAITCFPDGLLQYQSMDRNEKFIVLKGSGKSDPKRRIEKMRNRLGRNLSVQSSMIDSFPVDTIILNIKREDLVDDYLKAISGDVGDSGILEARIVFNLCLYLQSLPPGTERVEGAKWETVNAKDLSPTVKPKGSAPVITSGSQICDIIGRHILDSMIIDNRSESQRVSLREVDPHWRRAHRRRLPGQGHDPTAEKKVKVRHTLVREDRIPEVGVVKGSVTEIVN